MKTTKDLVLDIETLGVKPGAMILEISAQCGSESLDLLIDPKSHPGKVELDTLLWWSTVPELAAKERAFGASPRRMEMLFAIYELNYFIEKTAPDFYWGCSPSFDFEHLAYWYRFFKIAIPWKYHQLRDVRTVRDFLSRERLAELSMEAKLFGGCPHMSTYDARLEAMIVKEAREVASACRYKTLDWMLGS